jgi:hypothetical protein
LKYKGFDIHAHERSDENVLPKRVDDELITIPPGYRQPGVTIETAGYHD